MMFNVDFSLRIIIENCPKKGLEALDWRRERGLPERLDNRMTVEVRSTSESDFRQLVAAGYQPDSLSDGSGYINGRAGLPQEYDPRVSVSFGHRATIPVTSTDTPVEIAVRALRACQFAVKRSKVDVPEMHRQLKEAREMVLVLHRQLDEARQTVRTLERELLEFGEDA